MPGDFLSTIETLFLIVALAAFALIVWRAFSPRNKDEMERHGRIPLDDDPDNVRVMKEDWYG